MRRLVLVMLLAATLTGCKTSGLVPSKFDGVSWGDGEGLAQLIQFLVGANRS
jgi:hypothetical protein